MKLTNLLPDHYIEHEYFNKMFTYFDPEVFKDKHVVVSHDYDKIPVTGKNVVAILTAGDETGRLPKYKNDVGIIFKHHLDEDNIENAWHIPLPYVGGFTGNSDIPINDRVYDVCFIGRNGSRYDFIKIMDELSNRTKFKWNWCYHITGRKFMGGLPIEEYSEIMSNSKIVLSPQGAKRADCLRFSEAVKSGCAIIACKHPPNRVFKNCPAIYIDDWKRAEMQITNLLADPENLNVVHRKMERCWDDFFNEESVAKYISKVVRCHG